MKALPLILGLGIVGGGLYLATRPSSSSSSDSDKSPIERDPGLSSGKLTDAQRKTKNAGTVISAVGGILSNWEA